MPNDSMLGKWDRWYKNVGDMGAFRYGDTVTYGMAADFMADIEEVEDWGCGTGGFKRFYKGKYVGVDGSANKFVDKVADLRVYRTNVDGIVMRHVLEHNYDWKPVLENAVASFNKKLCLIIFTPFSDATKQVAHNKKYGVDVPDISFSKKDIEGCFAGLNFRREENIKTKTGYGVEHIYFIEKENAPAKIAVLSANLGGFDHPSFHVPQSLSHDYFMFTDENFPPRIHAMVPRLQAKIPKFFSWQMKPGYDYYLWIDGNLSLAHPDSLKYFYDQCQGYDIVVLKHPVRPDIRQEVRYTRKGVKQKSLYFMGRYPNELLKEQYEAILADKDFVDDLLVCGGIFMFRNTPEIQNMFKEWWYNVSRYIVQDQISFPYALKKSGVKIKVLPDVFNNCPYLKAERHMFHSK
ncbi:MAG: glycosyltransferase domain-containing protein [Candidatus Paceibacterota bacterium]|jgi:hypothetical protein|nr:DUF616 domain-containing protein [Candidatus Paceibacterota bacterium]